jgi:hypothetical protein
MSRASLVSLADSLLNVREDAPNANRGAMIDEFNKAAGCDLGSPWCASFINFCGRMGLEPGETWPFKNTASVQEMVDDAKAKGLFTEDPTLVQPGDLVTYFFEGLQRYGHIGVVKSIRVAEHAEDGTTTVSIDGNTIPDRSGDSREGFGVFEKFRTVGPHTAFLIWPTEQVAA